MVVSRFVVVVELSRTNQLKLISSINLKNILIELISCHIQFNGCLISSTQYLTSV